MPLPPDIPHQWGLATMINTKALPTGRAAGSLMWAGLANSYYWIDPHTGIAGVFMTQILPFADRSEEHTSELQSLMRISYAVFCLKKKNNILNSNQHVTVAKLR